MPELSAISAAVEASTADASVGKSLFATGSLHGFQTNFDTRFRKIAIRGKRMALLTAEGHIFLCRLKGDQFYLHNAIKTNQIVGQVTTMDFSLDSHSLLVGYSSGALKVYHSEKGSLRTHLTPRTQRKGIIRVMHSETCIIIQYADGCVYSVHCRDISRESILVLHEETSEPAVTIAAQSNLVAWATSHFLYIISDFFDGRVETPLATVPSDNFQLPSIAIFRRENAVTTEAYFVFCAVSHFLTIVQLDMEKYSFKHTTQESISFDNDIACVRCPKSSQSEFPELPIAFVMDSMERLYVVVGNAIVWFLDISDRGIIYDVTLDSMHFTHSREWGNRHQAVCSESVVIQDDVLYVLGETNQVHTLKVSGLFEFLVDACHSLPKQVALQYAFYVGSKLSCFEPIVHDLLENVYQEVTFHSDYLENAGFASPLALTKIAVQVCQSTSWYGAEGRDDREHLLTSLYNRIPEGYKDLLFTSFTSLNSQMNYSVISPELLQTFFDFLLRHENYSEYEQILCSSQVFNFDFQKAVQTCCEKELWKALIHLCTSFAEVTTILKAIYQAWKRSHNSNTIYVFNSFFKSYLTSRPRGMKPAIYSQSTAKIFEWLLSPDEDDQTASKLAVFLSSKDSKACSALLAGLIFVPNYKDDPLLASFMTTAFVKEIFQLIIDKYQNDADQADVVLTELLEPQNMGNSMFSEMASADDQCLNLASEKYLSQTYIHLCFVRDLSEQCFTEILNFVRKSPLDTIQMRLDIFLTYLERWKDTMRQEKWLLVILKELFLRLTDTDELLTSTLVSVYMRLVHSVVFIDDIIEALEAFFANSFISKDVCNDLLKSTLSFYNIYVSDQRSLMETVEAESWSEMETSVRFSTAAFAGEIKVGRCKSCGQPIASAFYIYPDGELVHHNCPDVSLSS